MIATPIIPKDSIIQQLRAIYDHILSSNVGMLSLSLFSKALFFYDPIGVL